MTNRSIAIGHGVRAGVVLASGLLIAFTWPLVAAALGLVAIVTATWCYRKRLAAATPYLVAGALLVIAGPAVMVITPSQEASHLELGPVQTCGSSASC